MRKRETIPAIKRGKKRGTKRRALGLKNFQTDGHCFSKDNVILIEAYDMRDGDKRWLVKALPKENMKREEKRSAYQRQLTTSPSIPKEIAGEKVLMEELAGA